MRIKALIILLNMFFFISSIKAANDQISKVHIIFKTHLDIGFTDLSSVVEDKYIKEFIPKAMDVADELRTANGEERYIWTTGTWLVQSYLNQATPEQRKRFEKAIKEGDIVWNCMPYTVESESMSGAQFESLLQQSKILDARFGKKNIGGKMTDVPGHTRGIVSILSKAGVRFLHIGVNPASTVPSVPEVCRWKDAEGNEIILMYQKDYGSDIVLPDGKTAMVIAFTGDNHGPHSVSEVKNIYSSLRKKYPNAKLVASTLSDVALDLEKSKNLLPVFSGEIGDTWIHGYGSSPLRMAQFRELSRLYDQWIESGEIDPKSEVAVNFMLRLGLIAEHTWGLDVKTHIKHWDKYDFDQFQKALLLPNFQKAEVSWNEITDNINKAIAFLPTPLKKEAQEALRKIENVKIPTTKKGRVPSGMNKNGAFKVNLGKTYVNVGPITYQAFSMHDYKRFFTNYITKPYDWAFQDFGKPGLENSVAKSVVVEPVVIGGYEEKNSKGCFLSFKDSLLDNRVFPENIFYDWKVSPSGNQVEINVGVVNKPANRLPEAYWFSFYPQDVLSVFVQKTGQMVDVLEVVEGGNRQLHGIDRYVDIKTNKGTIRIRSLDALLVAIGDKDLLNYSTKQPDINKGIHFCLFNNVWGTNFSQWFKGSVNYRFSIELI